MVEVAFKVKVRIAVIVLKPVAVSDSTPVQTAIRWEESDVTAEAEICCTWIGRLVWHETHAKDWEKAATTSAAASVP